MTVRAIGNLVACVGMALAVRSAIAASDDTAEVRSPSATVIVVVGAEGMAEYGQQFRDWAQRWQDAAQAGGAECRVIGIGEMGDEPDREQLRAQLQAEAQIVDLPLWLVLIGHGTSYRDMTKFNARGADFSAAELHEWLSAIRRPLSVINCTSSSGPFIKELAGTDRVVITATKSGAEQNYARFGGAISESITDPSADLDHDQAVSLLEAFLHASDQVARFYSQEARLATEHALLDDNGDGLGTPGTFFLGVRAVKAAQGGAEPDGRLAKRWVLVPPADAPPLTAEQLAERERLEQQLEQIRDAQDAMSEAEYLDRLETVLIPLARLATQSP